MNRKKDKQKCKIFIQKKEVINYSVVKWTLCTFFVLQLTGITSVFCQCWNKKKHAFAPVTTIAAVEAVTWPQSRMALESRLRCFLHGLHGLLARCCLGCRLGSTAYRPGELSLVPLRGVGGDGEPQVRAPRTTKTHWSRMAILT